MQLSKPDPMQADAFAADVRDVLIAHADEMPSHQVNSLEYMLQLLETWADVGPRS